MGAVFGRHRTRDHDGARGHAAAVDFACGTVQNLRALTDKDAHRNHGIFFHDDAFDDFTARTDKAVVFNDGGTGLNGFKNPADTGAAG